MNRIPQIGLGTWKALNPDELVNAIKYAVKEAGYTHIDCAACYENEEVVGKALREVFSSGVKRENIWVTSKLWNTQHHPDCVEAACRKTLKDLGLDYLDLYLIHHPANFKRMKLDEDKFPRDSEGNIIIDYSLSIIDTWKAMEKLVEKGLVKHIGVSNFSINQLERIKFSGCKIKPYTNQVEFHLYFQQGPLRRYMHDEGIIFTGYSCLGAADFNKGPVLLDDPVLKEVAQETKKSVGEVALRFLLHLEPGASLLAKSVKPERIYKNNHLNFELTEAQINKLRARDRFFRYVNAKELWRFDQLGDGW